MGKFTRHCSPLKVAVIKTVHAKRSEVVKIGSGCNLKRGLALKTGMSLIAKTIEDEKDTSHRYLKDFEENQTTS
jgi:succinate dehydrogenase/fumarate reductase flavoprotein subunit